MGIQEIKQRLTIQTTLQHYGLQPDRNGMLKCPFHNDNTPSLKIYKDTHTFHCFGCGANGDVIEFIQQKDNCNKHAAIVKAKELTGQSIGLTTHTSMKTATKTNGKILTKIFTYFQNGLNSGTTKKPKEYLEQRGLLPSSIVEMGYNSGQFHHRDKLNEADKQACIDAGLLIPYKGAVPKATGATYTAFAKECIIFPLKNNTGNIVSLYGRKTTDDTANKHYYLKNRTGLYPNHPNPNTQTLILTEAIIDAATLLQIPVLNTHYSILSLYGTNGLTAEHKRAIQGLQKLEEIIFFFDGDQAGQEAVRKHQQALSGLLQHVKLSAVETPEGEDINSLYVNYDEDAIVQLLDERKPLKEYQEPSIKTQDKKNDTINSNKSFNTNNPEFITYTTGELQIILLGGINLQQLDRLRVTIKITRTDTNNPLHAIRHTIDLYHSDYLEKFIIKASEQLETGTTVLRTAIAGLTDQIEQYRLTKIENHKTRKPQQRQLTDRQYRKAVNYLKSSKLMERTNQDIGKTGMIGEENNRLLMYLIFTSRLREQPLHIISLGASGTGKTYLQEKVSELIPQHHKLEITILSENAFYYFDRKELKHKLILIEDMDGAENVLYPLRELQSKKRISKTIPIKDNKGNLKTITLQVEGPISLAGTTTREKLYEDNANRSLLIYLDGSRSHNEAIMGYQRKLSAGKINTGEETKLKNFFRDMQTVLKPIKVRNPYAEHLKLPEYVFKPLRTNSHYLAVIETITFYHQYQREIKKDPATGQQYIETTIEDIQWANKLLADVLLAKSDELPRAVRQFFEQLKRWLKKGQQQHFYAKEIRERLRMYPMKINRYIHELESRGFIRKTGGNRKTGFEYETCRWDDYTQLQSGTGLMNDILNQLQSKKSSAFTESSRSITQA